MASTPSPLTPNDSCSYCRLETTFSVYVYGALPPSIIPVEISIVLLTATILLGTWLAYIVPTLLHTGRAYCSRGSGPVCTGGTETPGCIYRAGAECAPEGSSVALK